jgi:carbon-monoxide dehydrogenase large subunit
MKVNADGTVTVHSVAHAQGQGHETMLAMVVARALEIAPERVIVRQGMNDPPLIGNHTGGSRNTVGNGGVCHVTALKLIEQAKRAVAEQWGVEPSQVDYAGGKFRCAEPARAISLSELAARQPLNLIGEALYGSTWPNGCHIAEVEVDPDTGSVDVVAYTAVDDFGTVVHEQMVEGQVHGAVLQGAGQVFGEHAYYHRQSGQMLAASFMDYFMPRASLIRDMTLLHHPTPSRVSPLGVKGAGEAGVAAALPALVDAVLDALAPLGIAHLNMPLSPAKIWAAIQDRKAG